MGLTFITSHSNSVCKQVVSLQQRKHRKNTGLFVLEGLRGVKDALAAGWVPEYFMVTDGFLHQSDVERLVVDLSEANITGYRVTNPLMKKMAETETPQGLLCVFHQPLYDVNKIMHNPEGFWLVLDRIQDPGNLGTLIRSAEAAGVSGVFLTYGSTDPYNAKALRAGTGAVLHLPVMELTQEQSDCQFLLDAGVHMVGAALERGEPYGQVTYQRPLALVIGNEANGIDGTLLKRVDGRVTIPMRGRLQSLNAAIAGSILLFHIAEAVHQK